MSPAPRKKKADSAEEVEKQVSEEAAKSVPRAQDTDEQAPAEESSEAAAVEASAEEDKPKKPASKPRAKKADAEDAPAEASDDDAADEAPASGAVAAADDAPAKPRRRGRKASGDEPAKPARKRDQPRAKREPGEAPVLVRAQARYVRTSARKARLVCDHIRGKDVEQARAILSFTPRGAAKPWMKLLESAIANAEHNHELVGDELKIASVHADEGPTLKRYRPRAMGRATRIRKRTSHLTITLTPKE
jgi:ribosomal protein L22